MKWAEVSILTTQEATDVVAEIFHDAGAAGVVIDDLELVNSYIDAGEWDFSDVPRMADSDEVTVKAYLPADDELEHKLALFKQLIADFKQRQDAMPKGSCLINWQMVQDEDWADNWKKYFHPDKIGEQIVIKPSWEDYTAKAGEIIVELDPGAAFGTGTHPTTAMCIRALEKLIKPTTTVFDVGTGSGVLAITAAKLGAKAITAMDYDSMAAGVAAENVANNQVADKVTTGVSDLLKAFTGTADLIVANIIADIIIELFKELDEHLAPQGKLLASGIITERLNDVTAACEKHGFVIEETMEEKGWVALIIGRGEK